MAFGLAIGAAEARSGYPPGSVTIKTSIVLGCVALKTDSLAIRANRAAIEPITISVQTVFYMHSFYSRAILRRYQFGFFPGDSFNL